ncbi:MAG: hypothetical protein K2H34_05730 [Lachnospiraceae bacterium]|nr:hypothetical protein [Lachnospiraceae bacterium]
MEERSRKIAAPIIITVIFVIYFLFYFIFLLGVLPGIVMKLLFGFVPFILAAVMIFVCIQRIGEIRSGEEDDLSQY